MTAFLRDVIDAVARRGDFALPSKAKEGRAQDFLVRPALAERRYHHVRAFSDLQSLADDFVFGFTVTINRNDANPAVARRATDFLSGIALAARGRLLWDGPILALSPPPDGLPYLTGARNRKAIRPIEREIRGLEDLNLILPQVYEHEQAFVLDLSYLSIEVARQVIDHLSGGAYVLKATLERVGDNSYAVVPSGVSEIVRPVGHQDQVAHITDLAG